YEPLIQRHHTHHVPPTFPTRRSSDLRELHDAVWLWKRERPEKNAVYNRGNCGICADPQRQRQNSEDGEPRTLRQHADRIAKVLRSEEHTSELQSLAYLVCRLLLEKKK